MNLDEIALKVAKDFGMDHPYEAAAYGLALVAELAKQEPVGEIRIGEFDEFQVPLPHLNVGVSLPIGTKLYTAPVIHAGWVMVPVKPTEAMKDVGDELLDDTIECAHNVWNAMIAAAGEPK